MKEKRRILIVEDEVIIAEDLKSAIEEIGFTVVGYAVSADEAVEKALKLKPDLILMDIILKGKKNGIEASIEIKKEQDIPIIFLTAYADTKMIEKAKSIEPYAYLIKPFQERQLLASIEMAIYKNDIETKLKEKEEWLRTTLNSIGDGAIATDTKGNITFMNPIAQNMTEWKEDKAKGKPLNQIFKIKNEVTGKPAKNPVDTVLKKGMIVKLTDHTVLISKNGKTIPIDDSGAAIKNQKGEIMGTILIFHNISERRKTEKKLLDSNKRFKDVTTNSLEWIWEVDAKGKYTYSSTVVEKILGYRPEEIVNKKYFYDHFHPEDKKKLKKAVLRQFAKKKRFFGFQNKNIHKNKSPVWLSTSGVPIIDEKGKLLGYRGTDSNITEKIIAEKDIKHLNSLLNAIRIINKLIIKKKKISELLQKTCDALTKTLDYNTVWIGLIDSEKFSTVKSSGFGSKTSDLNKLLLEKKYPYCIKKAFSSDEDFFMIDNNDKNCRKCSLKTCKNKETAIIKIKHDNKLYGFLTISLLIDNQINKKEKSLLKEMAEDIAFAIYNIKAEKAHQASEKALKHKLIILSEMNSETSDINIKDIIDITILQKMQDSFSESYNIASLIFDNKGNAITRPSNFCDFCKTLHTTKKGAKKCEISDRYISEMTSKNPAKAIPCRNFEEILNAAVPITIGKKRIGIWGIGQKFIDNVPEEKIRKYARSINIDENKLLKAAKKINVSSKEEFEQAISFLEVMSNNISLIGLQNIQQANEIKKRKKIEEELLKSYKKMKELEIMRDEFVNIATHELKTPLVPIFGYLSIILKDKKLDKKHRKYLEIALKAAKKENKLIGNIMDFSKLESDKIKFNKTNIDIENIIITAVQELNTFAIEKNIKIETKIQEGLPKIYGDKQRLTQVITNLINNSIKFTDKGSITVKAKYEREKIIISIKDTGIGISKNIIPKVFTKFFQADSTLRRKQDGVGLGLSICKRIIEAHDGNLWVKSTEGKGSTFTFTLPLKESIINSKN